MENSCLAHLRTEQIMGAIPICEIPFTATVCIRGKEIFADVYLKTNLFFFLVH